MTDEPVSSDPAGRRPEGPASPIAIDRVEVTGRDPWRFPHGERGRRVSGKNEIRWSIAPDGRRVGEIVAHLSELHPSAGDDPQPPASARGGPVGADGRPVGWQFFRAGLGDLFPDAVPVDWASWAAVEDAMVAQIRSGHEVTLTTRAVPDPSGQPSLALRIQVVDSRTHQSVQYPYATLAEHVRVNRWSPVRRPAAARSAQPGPVRPGPAPQSQPPSPARTTPQLPPGRVAWGPHVRAQAQQPVSPPPDPRMGVAQPAAAVAGASRQAPAAQVPVAQAPAPQPPQVTARQAELARGVLGTAFGVLAPAASPLRDGGIRLNDAGDALTRDEVDQITARLAQRAAEQASPPRMLAEAVAMVGDSVARTAGEHPADGATVALDRLLDVPFLPEQNRAEAESVLHAVLTGRAHTAPPGRHERPDQRSTVSGITGAAEEISRDARVLQAGNPAPGSALAGLRGSRPQVGRQRPPAGGRHRQVEPGEAVAQALNAAGEVRASDLGGIGGVSPIRRTGPTTAVVALDGYAPQHFQLEFGSPVRRQAAVEARSGTSADPHVLRLPRSAPGGDFSRVWVRAIADVAQQQATAGAGAGSGIIGRLRSGWSGAHRDRQAAAKYAEFRLLSRNWQETSAYVATYGPFDDGRRLRDLERQLSGVSAGIARLGHSQPVLPWETAAVQVNAVPAPAGPTGPTSGPRPSDLAHLRHRVSAEIESLEASSEYLRQCARYKTGTAAAAAQLAGQYRQEATKYEVQRDDNAAERARKQRVEADAAVAIQRRHTAVAGAYTAAADRAVQAQDGFRAMLAELDALSRDPGRSADALVALADDAGRRVASYRAGVAATQPGDFVLPSAVPVGRLPFMTTVTETLNKGLRAHGAQDRHLFSPEQLHWLARSELGQVVSEDGLVWSVAGAGDDASQVPQFRLVLKAPDRTEQFGALDPHSEMIVGQLDQRSETLTTTTARSRAYKGKFGLRTLTDMLPPTGALKAFADLVALVAPKVETEDKRSGARTSTKATGGRRASVEDIRGETVTLACANPVWELQFRSSPFEPWSAVETVSSGASEDAQSLLLRMSHAYTVQAPAETTDLAKEGFASQRETTMPEHMATHVGGMNELADKAAAQLHEEFGDLSAVAYGEVQSLLNEWPGRLDEAVRPGGFSRPIIENGVEIGTIQAETFLVWESIALEGEPSPDHWVERVRVGLATTGVGQTTGVSTKTGLAVGYTGKALSDVGTTSLDLGPNGRVSRAVANEEGLSTTAVKYEVGVERAKLTQGYRLKAVNVLTVHNHDLDERRDRARASEPVRVDVTGDVLLRMPEANACRFGFPVSRDAVVRDAQGRARRHPDGRIRLRGDAQPKEKLPPLPAWWGKDADRRQLRGKGVAQVVAVTGLEERLGQVLAELEREELVPPLDAQLQPRIDALPHDYDKVLLGSQLRNLDRVKQAMSPVRVGPNYDQATQGRLMVPLEKRRSGFAHAPETHLLELGLVQRFETAQVVGVSTAETPLYLDIKSVTSAESLSSAVTYRADGSLGLKGLANGLGVGGNVSGAGTSGVASGVTSNLVRLREGAEEAVLASVMHSGAVTLWSSGGPRRLAAIDGESLVLFEGEQCRPAPDKEFWSIRGQIDLKALGQPHLLHLDVRDPLDKIWAALPPATQADPAARLQLGAFLDVRDLIADPKWIGKVHRTHLSSPAPGTPRLTAQQGALGPSNVTVELRALVVDLEHLSSGSPVSGDIDLTLRSNTRTDGSQRGRGVTGSGSGGVGASTVISGTTEVGRSSTDSRSESRALIGGSEGLGIEVGVQDTFRARVVLEAVVRAEGRKPVTVPLSDGAALYSIPERKLVRLYGRRLLDLPVERTAQAVERCLNGNLALDRRTANGLIRRYQEDRDGVTGGLAGSHTDQELLTMMAKVSGVEPNQPGGPGTGVEQSLGGVLDYADTVQDQRQAVALPEHFETMMAESLVQDTALFDPEGRDADVLGQVMGLVRQKVPGAFETDPTLADALAGEMQGDRWLGHRDDIWSPRGWVRDYTVKTSELGPPERVRVRIRGQFRGPAMTDGTPDPPQLNATNIQQLYLYDSQSQSRSRKVDYIGNVGLGAMLPSELGVTGTIGTHRVHSLGATNSKTLTWMSRIAHAGAAEVERDFQLLVEVERIPAPESRDRLRRTTDRFRAEEAPDRPVGVVLHGRMTQLVPRSYVGAATPAAALAPDRDVDHRAVVMPDNPYYVGAVRPHLAGEKPRNALFDAVAWRLAQPDLLTHAGVARHQVALETHLAPSRLQSAFKLFVSSDGYRIDDLDVPGHRRKVSARVNLTPYDLELVAGPVAGVELGEVFRSEVVTQSTVAGNRLLPTTRSVDGGGAELGGGVTVGEQVTDKVTDLSGSRGERSMFTKPDKAVVVRVRYDADVTYERRGLFRRSKHKIMDKLRGVAKGEAFVTMSERDYNALRARMESQATLPRTPEPGTPTVTRSAQVHVYDEGKWSFHPYKPLVDALAEAREKGAVVALTVERPDGALFYQAYPNGVLTANDGGFAEAFSTLHPSLARLAEGRVDLYDLYYRHRGPGSFTQDVAVALDDAGVEPSIVAEAAHSVVPSQAPKHLRGAEGAAAHPDGGRPTISSGTTPGAAFGGVSV